VHNSCISRYGMGRMRKFYLVDNESLWCKRIERKASEPKRSDRSDIGLDRADLCQGRPHRSVSG